MKILITGGTGVLSAALVDDCVRKGFDVTMINRGNKISSINPLATLIKCDIRRDITNLKKQMKDLYFDAIFDFLVLDVQQLKVSLELFGNKCKQYFFISSAQVYDTTIERVHNETDLTPQRMWHYSINKDNCEKYLKQYCKENNVNYTIIRPGVTYDNRRIPYGMYPTIGKHYTLIQRIRAGKPIITWNNGNNKLNLTRVEDFANATSALIGNKYAINSTFNIVGDYVYSWNDVLDVLEELLNIEVRRVNVSVDLYAKELAEDEKEMLLGGRSFDLVCSNEKLKSVIPNFETRYSLKDGMQKTIDYLNSNSESQEFDYRWDAECDRIIKKITGQNNNFANYSNSKGKEYLYNFVIYNSIKHQDKLIHVIWKGIKKLINICL